MNRTVKLLISLLCLINVMMGLYSPSLLANDRMLNEDLIKRYNPKNTDYVLQREKLLAKYRKEKTPMTLLMAYHRRFSSFDRHEVELLYLFERKKITKVQADQFRLIFYLVRGPLEKATSLLFRAGWSPDLRYWLMAMQARFYLLTENEERFSYLIREIIKSPERLRYIYPWIFSIPFENQSWRLLYFLKQEIWPKVLEILDGRVKDKPFFVYLTNLPDQFPFIPFNTHSLKKAPPVFSAIRVLLMIKWVDALYLDKEDTFKSVKYDMEYYYPNSIPYVRLKTYMAKEEGNRQLYKKLMAQLKAHDPHFWRVMKGKRRRRNNKSTRRLMMKLLGIYDIYEFLGRGKDNSS